MKKVVSLLFLLGMVASGISCVTTEEIDRTVIVAYARHLACSTQTADSEVAAILREDDGTGAHQEACKVARTITPQIQKELDYDHKLSLCDEKVQEFIKYLVEKHFDPSTE